MIDGVSMTFDAVSNGLLPYLKSTVNRRECRGGKSPPLEGRGVISHLHVPRQVMEASSLTIRNMNAQAFSIPPFQSTNVCILGICRTTIAAWHIKPSIMGKYSYSSCMSCDVSDRDSNCGQVHIFRQFRKTSSALTMKETARCCSSRLL